MESCLCLFFQYFLSEYYMDCLQMILEQRKYKEINVVRVIRRLR